MRSRCLCLLVYDLITLKPEDSTLQRMAPDANNLLSEHRHVNYLRNSNLVLDNLNKQVTL